MDIDKNNSEQLVSNVREWIKLDNEMHNLRINMKELQNKKKELTNSIAKFMKQSDIDCFDITDASIVYKQKKTKKTITGKYLLEQLEKYYNNNPEIAKQITQHVLENRVEIIKDEIKKIKK
jgi:hypothetical protein